MRLHRDPSFWVGLQPLRWEQLRFGQRRIDRHWHPWRCFLRKRCGAVEADVSVGSEVVADAARVDVLAAAAATLVVYSD